MDSRRLVALIACIALVACWRFRPRPLTETQRIRNEVELARQAIEAGSVRDLLRFVAESYTDNQGNSRTSLRQLTAMAFFQHPNLVARAGVRNVQVFGAEATADVTATVAERDSGGRVDLELQLKLAKREGRWQVTHASGVKTGVE